MKARCPICKGPARFLLEKNGCKLQECTTCEHIFVFPMLSQEEAAELYDHAPSALERKEEERIRDPKAIFTERIKLLKRYRKKGRLLDIGCSSGQFLLVAKKAGFTVEGIELNTHKAKVARKHGLKVHTRVLEDLGLKAGSFDIVHLGDVIEHVPDPSSFLKEITRVLKPGGIIIVATPNYDAFFPRATYLLYRMFRIPWSHPTPPEHLHQFSTGSLLKLLHKHGYEEKDIWYVPWDFLYELGATEIMVNVRRSIKAREPLRLIGYIMLGAITFIAYSIVGIIDKALFLKRKDMGLQVLAFRR